MGKLQIIPQKLSGTIEIPPSKSMAHRAIICASLAKGKSKISHIEYSQDIIATIEAMENLGANIEKYEDYLIIDGTKTFTNNNIQINCKESGSTLRFMVPISIIKPANVHFVGEGNLGKRPLDIFYNIFDHQNIKYEYTKDILDLHINGKIHSDTFKIPGNISSQFISGLLFALPLLEGDSKIIISSNLESKGYIDLTLQMLKYYGIHIENHNYQEFIIKGNQSYQSQDYYVEADYSQAAFYLVAGVLNNEVTLKGLNLDSLQGDKEILEILTRMGANIKTNGQLLTISSNQLKATSIDGSQCPDVIPVLALACALASGTSTIYNAKRLRIKECDRLKAVYSELTQLGVKIIEKEDGLIIEGVNKLSGGNLSSWNDHRIAMTIAIASTKAIAPIIIDNKECVKKSYPSFWEDFTKLGGIINEC